jgi:hypothetical protein
MSEEGRRRQERLHRQLELAYEAMMVERINM